MYRLCTLVAVLGCTSKEVDTGEDLVAVTTYFTGHSTITSYEGSPMNIQSELLIKKVIDPQTAMMIEEVYSPDEEYVMEYTIADSSFSGSNQSNGSIMETEGTFLNGEQWHWTKWESTSTYVEVAECTEEFCFDAGDYITSADSLVDDTLTVEKAFYRKDATENTFTIEEVLNVVDEASFQDALSELQGN